MERDADEKPALQEEEFLSGRSLLVAAGFSCFLALQTYCGLSIALPLALGHTQEYALGHHQTDVGAQGQGHGTHGETSGNGGKRAA